MIIFSEHNFEDHRGIDHESIIAWVPGQGFQFINGFINRRPTDADLNMHGWTLAELNRAHLQYEIQQARQTRQ